MFPVFSKSEGDFLLLCATGRALRFASHREVLHWSSRFPAFAGNVLRCMEKRPVSSPVYRACLVTPALVARCIGEVVGSDVLPFAFCWSLKDGEKAVYVVSSDGLQGLGENKISRRFEGSPVVGLAWCDVKDAVFLGVDDLFDDHPVRLELLDELARHETNARRSERLLRRSVATVPKNPTRRRSVGKKNPDVQSGKKIA